jgi:septum site-determining protein MinD
MTRLIAVIGGKGGIGKTTITSNLATVLAELGQDVVAVDANLTTPNLGLQLGLHLAPKTLHDVLRGKSKLRNATYSHPAGFKVVPGSISVKDLKGIDIGKLPEIALNLIGKVDYILLDSAAGLGQEALMALNSADEILLVTNPDLPSVTDALKTYRLATKANKKVIGVVVNRVRNKKRELKTEDIEEILGLPVLAEIPEDVSVPESISVKRPVVEYDPHSPASVEIRKLAHRLIGRAYLRRRRKKGIFKKLFGWIR